MSQKRSYFLSLVTVTLIAINTFAITQASSRNFPYERMSPGEGVDLTDANARYLYYHNLESICYSARSAAVQKALEKNWVIRNKSGGNSFELIALRNGHPVYKMTNNANSAISIATDVVQTGPFLLEGSGETIGIWDFNGVLTTHQEFGNLGGRVQILDDLDIYTDDHSTHVAGTIGAQGFQPAAKGMAPEVWIDSYNWFNDFSEMLSRGAQFDGEPDALYLSNHSYGLVAGWQVGDFQNLGTDADYWFGVYPEREDREFGRYTFFSRLWDQICSLEEYYLPVKSAGNDRTDTAPNNGDPFWYIDPNTDDWVSKLYDDTNDPFDDGWDNGGFDTMPPGSCAKNILVVGAVDDAVNGGVRDINFATMTSYSSWGPTDDGRIKPDLVANGNEVYSPIASGVADYNASSGTSMAAPAVAGSAVLIHQDYNDFFGERMRASTLKALILHTVDDLGNAGPDYQFGFGIMNTEAAVDIIALQASNPGNKWIIEGTLAPDTRNRYAFTSDGSPITATLCWTDPAGNPVDENLVDSNDILDHPKKMLINDLDLRIYEATNPNTVYYPYILDPCNPDLPATTGDNNLDNVEQIYIPAPNAVKMIAEIGHKRTNLVNGAQNYGLILSEPIPSRTIYVDDDAPDDVLYGVPGIPDPNVGGPLSDPNENGEPNHPFDSIQKAIDDINDINDVLVEIIVREGIYTGVGNYDIDTNGFAVTIKSQSGPSTCTIDPNLLGRAFIIDSNETATTVIRGFTIINGYAQDPNWPRGLEANDPNVLTIDYISGFGGAIYCNNSSPFIRDCIIEDCTADYAGGAIACEFNSNPIILRCNLSYNYAGSYSYGFFDVNEPYQMGGAIHGYRSSPTVFFSNLSFNQADGGGGAIALDADPNRFDSFGSIIFSTLNNNECWADDDFIYQHGGAVFSKNCYPLIWNCTLRDNTAKWSGGAIGAIWESDDATTVFYLDPNTRAFDSNGIYQLPTMIVSGCDMLDNVCWASGGSGVYNEGGKFVEETNEPDPNDPNAVIELIWPNTLVWNCLIADSWAYWSGALASDYGSYLQLESSTIANNVASYSFTNGLVGGMECYNGDGYIHNCIFWGNTGRQLAVFNGFLDVTYSNIQNFEVIDPNDPNGAADPNNRIIWPGIGNINTDPFFASPRHQDYHLKSTYSSSTSGGRYNPETNKFDQTDSVHSPCIDAGDPLSIYFFEPLPNGSRINMGAYGNTLQASKSDSNEPASTPGNIIGSYVSFRDFTILANNWMLSGAEIEDTRADFNHDLEVDVFDMAILADYWLWVSDEPQFFH